MLDASPARHGCRMDVIKRNNINVHGTGATTLVLSHGFGSHQGMWQHLLPLLADRYRIVTFDLVGSELDVIAAVILGGARIHDVWAVNEDAEYHESGNEGQISSDQQAALASERLVPSRLQAA